ncbi:MAG: MotA/TolQ/ExbB proton channel family protein, partial [Bacteroidales bacterium]
MKKLIAFLSVAILLSIGLNQSVLAQVEQTNDPAAQEMVAANDSTLVTDSSVAEASTMLLEDEAPVKKTFHQVLKEKFIEGGAGFMAIVLLCLIFGLALSIERIIYL